MRNSYQVQKLSIAVVVNKARIAAMLGEQPTAEQTSAFMAQLQQVVNTAAGVNAERGDLASITTMDFLDSEILAAETAPPGLMDALQAQIGTMINALAFIVVAALLVMFGFRPLLRPAGSAGTKALAEENDEIGLELPDFSPSSMGAGNAMPMEGFGADFGFGDDSGEDELELEESGTFNRRVKEGPERRLARMVEINEERAAKILRKWATQDAA